MNTFVSTVSRLRVLILRSRPRGWDLSGSRHPPAMNMSDYLTGWRDGADDGAAAGDGDDL